jgi:D-arginine dehydrogenase
LFVAREETMHVLDSLEAEMALFTDTIARVGEAEMRALCPILKLGEGAVISGILDRGGLRLDPHALLQGYARTVRAGGGETLIGQAVSSIRRSGGDWQVETGAGRRWSGPVLINAAGAWADRVAKLAGVVPLGLQPKRRTIIVVDPPAEYDVREWPFVKTAQDEFYMLPESGRLMASPVDEVDCEPSDAQPEDYDLALAAYRLEEYTTLKISRIAHRWAGHRTFTRDRVPTAGFAPDSPGFFWLAGQGGYGLQTAPAMALIVEALVTGASWPEELEALGVGRERITPERLFS